MRKYPMLTSFTVTNFRNLESVTLERLGRMTLIGGKNGVGKTALLEALWLLAGSDLPELSERINSFRGLPTLGPETIFQDIFRNFDTRTHIKMSASGDWGSHPRKLEIYLQKRQQVDTIRSDALERASIERLTRPLTEGEFELVFRYQHGSDDEYTSRAWWVAEQMPVGPVTALTNEGIRQERQSVHNRTNSVFMPAVLRDSLQAIALRFGKFQLERKDAEIRRFLCLLEPRLTGLTLIAINNIPVIHAYLDGMNRPIPIQLLGEGLNRMLGLVLSMSEASGGLLLIDEIENGLHHTVQEKVFSILLDMAGSFDVQIFATTHSDECIRAAHRGLAKQGQQALAFYRLDRVKESVKAVGFDSEQIETAIEYNMEIR